MLAFRRLQTKPRGTCTGALVLDQDSDSITRTLSGRHQQAFYTKGSISDEVRISARATRRLMGLSNYLAAVLITLFVGSLTCLVQVAALVTRVLEASYK